MTPPPVVPAPAVSPEQHPVTEQAPVAPEADESADLFRWMSWSAAIAMNA